MTNPIYGRQGQPGAGVTVRPKPIDISFMLWIAAAVIGIMASLLSFATAGDVAREAARAQLEKSGLPTDSLDGMDAAVTAGVGAGVIVGLVIFVAWIFIVFQMRNGKNWARIALTVLGGLAALFGFVGLFSIGTLFSVGALGVLQGLLSLVQLVVIITAIVFMFKADANAYFRRV